MTRITVVLALLAIACGLIGYSRVELGPAEGLGASSGIGRFFDRLYLSLGMLGVANRNTYGDPFLSVGRWFGVLFVFSAVLRALVPQAAGAITRARIARLRDHSVVIGMGAKGRAFARDFAARGPVVGLDIAVLERADVDGGAPARRLMLLKGDASAPGQLRRLNLARASRATVCTGDDARNHAIARRAIDAALHDRRAPPLDLNVHLSDADLAETLIGELPADDAVRVRPFSLPSIAARRLLARRPWLLGADRVLGGAQHWVLLGWDAHAQALVLQALKLGAGSEHGPPAITAFVADPAALRERLALAYPTAGDLLSVLAFEQAGENGLARDERLLSTQQAGRVTGVFVFASGDAQAFALAARARRTADRLGCWRAPIFVRLDDPSPWGAGLRPIDTVRRPAIAIEPFGSLAEACTAHSLADWHERLAQQVHADWRAGAGTAGPGAARAAADCEWHRLPEELRAANRRAIDHLPLKLAALGYIVRGGLPLPSHAVTVDPAQAAKIARLEHDSWCAEKRLAGWTCAPVRDDLRQRHDRLVPFERLATYDAEGASLQALLGAAAGMAEPVRGTGEGGAFLERVFAIVAREGPAPEQREALAQALVQCWRPWDGTHALGARGSEFWTAVVSLDGQADAVLVDAAAAALDALAPRAGEERRYRVIAVRAVQADAGATAAARFECRLATSAACEAVIELPATPPEPHAQQWRAADAFVRARCDHLIELERAADDPGTWAARSERESHDVPASSGAATSPGRGGVDRAAAAPSQDRATAAPSHDRARLDVPDAR